MLETINKMIEELYKTSVKQRVNKHGFAFALTDCHIFIVY